MIFWVCILLIVNYLRNKILYFFNYKNSFYKEKTLAFDV